MFKVHPPQVSAALCFLFLGLASSTAMAQDTPPPETPRQNDSAPMLDLTQQPTVAPVVIPTTAPTVTPTTAPTVEPVKPVVVPTVKPVPSVKPVPAIPTASAIPKASAPASPISLPTPQDLALPEDAERTDSSDGSTGGGSGADIPPDPNVLDGSMHTPIYTRPIEKAPPPLDGNSELPEEQSPYSVLAIVLWSCFVAAAGATGYFLYVRFGDKD